jgi:hypothetical protein
MLVASIAFIFSLHLAMRGATRAPRASKPAARKPSAKPNTKTSNAARAPAVEVLS